MSERMCMRLLALILLCLVNSAAYSDGLLDRLSSMSSAKKPVFLQPDKAFQVSVDSVDAHTLQANFEIAPGYYLYRDRISFQPANPEIKLSQPHFPNGEIKQDKNFGEMVVFHQSFQSRLMVDGGQNKKPVALTVSYQGCSEQGLCYPPIEKIVTVEMAEQASVAELSARGDIPPTENSKIAQILKSGNFWLVVSFFFGAGLLLAFTPCMFPMVPILSGIIVGRGQHLTKTHAFGLSLAYVLGMAITYALTGVAAGYSGELISNALQTPWALGGFAAVFVVLSFSMFGFYEIQLPSALQSKLSDTSNHLHGGHLGGVFLMGVLSAIIVGPCVAAPLAGALLYIGQTHDALLGGMALFALALGMGTPLLLIGTSAGALLPKAGAWMDAVKKFFGVMLLALAIWIIQPLLSISVQMFFWALLLILTAAYMRVLDALPANAKSWQKLRKGAALILLLVGVAYVVGALSGARDLLKPLGAFNRADQQNSSLQWTRVKNLTELQQHFAEAQGKIVVLDFYADWCVSCKEMERYIFSDAHIQARLKQAVLLQVDVTANSSDDKELLKKYALFGPPATLFFAAQGAELEDTRVLGYQDVTQFGESLSKAHL